MEKTMTTKKDVRIAWANQEVATIIKQLGEIYTDYKENSGLIQHELVEQAIDKLYKAYCLSKPNNNLDYLLVIDGLTNSSPLQVDHFN